MNMFSMKPKFDLAAFLAVPAPAGAARSRAKRRGMQGGFAAAPKTAVETPVAPTEAPGGDTGSENP